MWGVSSNCLPRDVRHYADSMSDKTHQLPVDAGSAVSSPEASLSTGMVHESDDSSLGVIMALRNAMKTLGESPVLPGTALSALPSADPAPDAVPDCAVLDPGDTAVAESPEPPPPQPISAVARTARTVRAALVRTE
jgi:hypothetical protein